MHVHWILVIAWVFCVGQHGVRSAIDTINWQGKHRINVYLAKRQKPTSNDPNEVRLQELWTQIQQLLYPSRLQKLGERPYDGESGSLQETIAGNIGAATGQSRTKLCRWSITPLNLRYQLMTRGKKPWIWMDKFRLQFLNLSGALYWLTDLISGTLGKAHMNLFKPMWS